MKPNDQKPTPGETQVGDKGSRPGGATGPSTHPSPKPGDVHSYDRVKRIEQETLVQQAEDTTGGPLIGGEQQSERKAG